MVKLIRKPLTDVNWNDFMTGKPVKAEVIEQEVNLKEKNDKWLNNKKIEAIEMWRQDGKIFVDGFGWVN